MAANPHLDEFERIARFFAPLAAPGALAACSTTSRLIAGAAGRAIRAQDRRHRRRRAFPARRSAGRRSRRSCLRVNLSDLAAKGAEPVGYLLMTALPPSLRRGLARGIRRRAWPPTRATLRHRASLAGIPYATPGPATLSVAAFGRGAAGRGRAARAAPAGRSRLCLRHLGRCGAGPGRARGRAGRARRGGARDFLIRPLPPAAAAPRARRGALAALAHAAADISDGLVADLGHICDGLGARRDHRGEAAAVVQSGARGGKRPSRRAALFAALAVGDDYELVFTAPPAKAESASPTLSSETRHCR